MTKKENTTGWGILKGMKTDEDGGPICDRGVQREPLGRDVWVELRTRMTGG